MPIYTPTRSTNYFLYFSIIVVSFVLGWQVSSLGIFAKHSKILDKNNGSVLNNGLEDEVDMDLFWTIWKELALKYVDIEVIKNEKMVYGAIKGMVDALDDPYTVFMTPEESKEFNASLDGTLQGIGAELTVESENLVVVSALRKSPAEKAGLLSGDIIYKIDDQPANELTLLDAILRIRGKKGTTVNLTIIRKDSDEPFEVSIVRDSIDIESVTVEKLDSDIIYLSVNQFNDKTNDEFSKAISEMVLDEPKGLIIDLRFNGGGYLDIAVELLSYILPSEKEAVEIVRKGKEKEVLYTEGNLKVLGVPLVVLVNNGSASASEIVAGAVQDHKRGIVMGTKTFGKGTVQEVESFSDGSSIRMTIAKWLTPNARNINKVGLIPDVVVELSESDLKNKVDAQKNAAVEYLKNL